MGWLLTKFALWGVPEGLRKPLAYGGAAVLALLLFVVLKGCYDSSIIDSHEDKRAVAGIEARDEAADERAADTIRNTEAEKELHDAIDSAPKGGALSPADLALNCQRLRNAGRPLPAACGPASGD